MRPPVPPMRPRSISRAAEEEVRTYVESVPPPADLADVQARLEKRLRGVYPAASIDDGEEISAIHDLHELQRRQRNADITAMTSRFELEHERRVVAEQTIKARNDRGWQVVVGVLIAVIAAGIIGGTVAVIHSSNAERPAPRLESPHP